MQTFKALGLLLEYPSQELQDHSADVIAVLRSENLLPRKIKKPLFAFIDDLTRTDLLQLQEEYVTLFDRSRAHALYLFEHVHGESRDRGQAMVDLSEQYRTDGLVVAASELPDYLPLFLEYLSLLPLPDAQSLLGETVHIIAAVRTKLEAKKSPYVLVFAALEALTTVKADKQFIAQAVAESLRTDTSLEALDKEWAETPAFDGTGAAAGGASYQPPKP